MVLGLLGPRLMLPSFSGGLGYDTVTLCGFRTPYAYVCTVRQYHGSGLPRRQSGSRSDKRLEGRGIETRDAQRTLWSHSHGTVAQCTRKHTASESHKVPLQHGWTKPKLRTRTRASLDKTTPEEGGSPRPRAFLLSERDPLCDKCIGAEAAVMPERRE